jgi:hypothetical protein
VQVAADGPHHDVAGVQPDPDLDTEPLASTELLTVPSDCRLHPEGRVARAHRVILVGEGGAEQRHNPVAHDLVDGALVAVNGLHHPL